MNDAEHLERTLHDVISLYPELASVALVPVGVSAFSDEATMRSHTEIEAAARGRARRTLPGTHRERSSGASRVFASDEFYLVAGAHPASGGEVSRAWTRPRTASVWSPRSCRVSSSETPMDKLGTGFFQSVDGAPALGYRAPRGGESDVHHGDDVLVVTGEYAAPILREMFDAQGFADVRILAVENRFFGGNIKVAGLLTGQDLIDALGRRRAGDRRAGTRRLSLRGTVPRRTRPR